MNDHRAPDIVHAHPARPPVSLPAALHIEAASGLFRAIGDPARLRLLLRIAAGERCVSELVDEESDKLSSVSARLQQLLAARLVSRRREGKHLYYALADQHVVVLLDNVLQHVSEASTR